MIYTEDFFAPGNNYPANDIVLLVDSFSKENVNFKKTLVWMDGTPMSDAKVDDIIYRKKDAFFYERVTESKTLNAKIFNPFCDGVHDDCPAISKMMNISSLGYTIDGNNLTYHLLNLIFRKFPEFEAFNNFSFINFTFKLGKNYDGECGWRIGVKGNVRFKNIVIDGGRGTYKTGLEKWIMGKPDTEAPDAEILPLIPNLGDVFTFDHVDLTSTVEIENFKAVNIHGLSVITIYSEGNVYFENSYFENTSMKPFHVYHFLDEGKTTSGRTYVSNIDLKDCGYLPDTFLENITNPNDWKIADKQTYKGMQHWSYGAIVTYGEYYIENIKVENYGSSAVCSDRNSKFFANNIQIINNSNKFESRNPSGAMWFEATGEAYINNLDINISDRGNRDLTFDSSALQIVNTELYIDNLKINTEKSKALLKKGIRASCSQDYNITINNIYIDGEFLHQPIYHGIMELTENVYPLKTKFVLNGGVIKRGKLYFYGSNEVNLSKIHAPTCEIDFKSPIANHFNKVSIKESSFYSFDTITHYKQMLLENSIIISDFIYNSKALDVVVQNSNVGGILTFPITEEGGRIHISGGEIGRTHINGYHVFIDNVKSRQGVYIDSAQFFTINNSILKTSESEPIIMVSNSNNRLISGIISQNILSIKTNTPSAGYIVLTPESTGKVNVYNNSETAFN